jgi:hypothetical protein
MGSRCPGSTRSRSGPFPLSADPTGFADGRTLVERMRKRRKTRSCEFHACASLVLSAAAATRCRLGPVEIFSELGSLPDYVSGVSKRNGTFNLMMRRVLCFLGWHTYQPMWGDNCLACGKRGDPEALATVRTRILSQSRVR